MTPEASAFGSSQQNSSDRTLAFIGAGGNIFTSGPPNPVPERRFVFGKLLLLFILVPLADLFLLMVMSSYTGWPFSIALVIVSGIIGAFLAKQSYRSVWNKMQSRLANNQLPADLLSDGAMIFFAAGLLLTPGFITDAVGLTLLIPVCRRWYKARLTKWLKRHFQVQVVTMRPPGHDDDVVEGEVVRPDHGPPKQIGSN